MSKICQITGKKAMIGNNVSHSKRRTKRTFDVNLFTKKFYYVEQDCWISLNICANGLRVINKKGLDAALNDAVEKLDKAGVDMLHVDVMDGHFVPNLAFSPDMVKALKKDSNLLFESQLPRTIDAFIQGWYTSALKIHFLIALSLPGAAQAGLCGSSSIQI